jgi:hypothetical protein
MTEAAFQFPDELDDNPNLEIDIVDDTPPEDRNIAPLPKEMADELETLPESEEYSKQVKNKFLQYKKVYHDERRAKEAAQREQEEALDIAQKILDENKRLKALLKTGEEELINTYKTSAELEVDKAKRRYKEVYDNGTTDEIIDANQELIKATSKLDKATNFRPTMGNTDSEIQLPKKQPQATVDPKVEKWVSENPWYIDPSKKKMAKYALAVHEDLLETKGQPFVGTSEYFSSITDEVKRRFPEEFPEDDKPSAKPQVVAPVKRSTSTGNKVTLRASQLAIAKKLGLTPEQYAKEVVLLEKQHG